MAESKKEYERYLQERNALEDARYKTADNYDKAILTLTGGALAISMTFIADIAKVPTNKFFLISAWFFFGVSLITHLINYRICMFAHNRALKELDKEQELKFNNEEYIASKDIWPTVTELLNYANLVLFLIGIIFLGIFVFLNM